MGQIILALLGLFLYLLPAFIAWQRGHPNTGVIVVTNILLGWTVVGWIAVLIWSFTSVQTNAGE